MHQQHQAAARFVPTVPKLLKRAPSTPVVNEHFDVDGAIVFREGDTISTMSQSVLSII
jgi:hypothetical protein